MADQAERVILEAEDNVTPITNKANAALDGFEKKATSSHEKVIRISDQTRNSVQRLITSLEKQSEVYGKSGVEKLIVQRDQLLQRYAKEPAAVDAITRSYEKMIETQKRLDQEHARFGEGFAERVKQTIENPLNAAQGMMTSVLHTMGPMGVAVAAGVATLTALAAAGYEAAKSLGEWGTRVRDVELRTGLTAKQVGEFDYAARAVGQDVAVVEKMMRGLTQAIEGDSAAAEKAREMLVGMRVDLNGVKNGSVDTAEVLLQISESLSKMPTVWERNEAALTLFKKAGIETIPMILELSEKIKEAQAMGFGFREEDVERAHAYQGQVAAISRTWQDLARQIKEPLAVPILFVLKGMVDANHRGDNPWVGAAMNFGLWATLENARQQQEVASVVRGGISTMMGWAPGGPGMPSPPDFSGNAAGLMTVTGANIHMADVRRKDQAAVTAALSKGVKQDAEKEITRLQGLLVEPSEKGWKPGINDDTYAQIKTQKDIIAAFTARTEAAKKAATEAKEWQRQSVEFQKKGDESEMSALEKIYYLRDLLLKQGEKVRASESDLAKVRVAAGEQAAGAMKKINEAFQKQAAKDLNASAEDRIKLGLVGPGAGQLKEWEEGFKADERIAGIEVDTQRQELRRKASRAGRMADLNPSISYEQAALEAYRTRVDLAVQLGQIEADRIAKEENSATKRVLAAQAQKELFLELAQAQDEFDQKRAELAQKRQQELQRQIDELTHTFEGLFHTLLTKPGDFGKQLGSTLREAALKPITEGLGGMLAQTLHPLIYGAQGDGGVAGAAHAIFGGAKLDPVTVTSDNTTATVQNSKAIWLLTAVLSEYMGRGVPAALGTQGDTAIPNIGVASPSGLVGQMLRNTGGLPRFAEGGVTNGPTIVGEAGRELVIPLDKLLAAPGPNSPFPYLHGYGPDTAEALGKFSMGMMNIALPASLAGIGGPAGLEAGNVAMALLLGGLAEATPPRTDGVLQGVIPIGRPNLKFPGLGRAGYAAFTDEEKLAHLVDLANDIKVKTTPATDLLSATEAFRLPGVEGGGLVRDVYNPALGPHQQRITTLDLPMELRGQGAGQALYLAAMSRGPINWEEPFTSLKVTEDASRVRAALVQKGLAERRGDWMTLTEKAEQLLGVKAPATPGVRLGDPTWFDLPNGRDPWNQTTEQHQAIGRLGGIAAGKVRRLAAALRDPELDASGNYIGPPVDGPIQETMAEATARIDAVAPHLIGVRITEELEEGAISRSAATKAAMANPKKLLINGQLVTAREASKLLGLNSATQVTSWMNKFGERDWTTIDMAKELFDRGWRGQGKLPAFNEGTTMNTLRVGYGDEQLTIGEAAKRIGKPSDNSVRKFLSKFAEKDWSKIDLQKELNDRGWTGGKMPSYDEGGTVSSTGVAVVHQGEAVVPQADSLKHSIDANTKALQTVPGALMMFARSFGARMAQSPQSPGSVVQVSGGAAQQPMVGVPEVVAGSDSMSPSGWGAGIDPYTGQVYQPGPLPSTFGGSTAQGHSFSLPGGFGNPSQLLHGGVYTAGTALLSSGVRTGNPLSSAMGGAGMGFGLAPSLGVSGTWGAVTGAGAGVMMAGLSRGGASGTMMSMGGGALVGFQMGGPIGAAVGAAAGLTAGLIREFGVETLADTAHKDIKQVYGVDIPTNSGVIKQIVNMAQQQFGGSISMAVRSPSVRELVMLYAESTGQKMPMSSMTPRAGSLVEQGGSLYQAPSFQNGTPYVLPSSIPSVANLPGMGTYPMPGGTPTINMSMHIDGASTASFMTGNYVTPEFVQNQSMAAQNYSYQRLQGAANAQQPGLYV